MLRALVDFSLARPRTVLAIALIATIGLAAGLARLEIRTAGALLEPERDPVIEARRGDASRFRDRREVVLVVSAHEPAATLASPSGMRALRALDAALRAAPELDPTRVRSLASLPRLRPSRDGVDLARSLDRIPEPDAAFERWYAELRVRTGASAPLVSSDGTRALVVVALADAVSAEEGVGAIAALRDRIAPELGLEVWIGGPLVAETMLGSAVLRDLAKLIPVMLLVILGLLAATVRSPAGLLIPMLEIALVLLWTFGAMGWLGVPVTLVTTILPVVLMAMCIADEIHFLERLEAQPDALPASERIRTALEEIARPIVLTSLTTALAFLSFLSASIAPLRSFGLFAAFGILAALLLTLTVVPALSLLWPRSLERFGGSPGGARPASRISSAIAARPGGAFALGAVAAAVLAAGAVRLEVGDAWVANFSPTDEIVRATDALDDSFWGAYRLDLVFEGPEGLFTSSRGIRLLDVAGRRAAQLSSVGGVESPVERLAELTRGIGDDRPVLDLSPGERLDLVTLAEAMPDGAGLASLLSSDGRSARLRLFVRHADHRLARLLERELDAWLPALAEQAGASVRVGGELAAAAATIGSIVGNQMRSIAWTLASLGLLLYLSARSARALLSIVPPCVATAAVLGAMGWGGMELGVATSMFASMEVGVGVDFGIYLQHRLQRSREAGAHGAEGLARALEISSRALAWNVSVLAGGFLVLLLSDLRPNRDLGLLLAAATLGSYCACLLLLPRLLLLAVPLLAVPLLAAAPALAKEPMGAAEPAAKAEIKAERECPAEESPALTERMKAAEQVVRERPRLFRMEIEAAYIHAGGPAPALGRMVPNTLWGAVRHDGDATRLLYVFSGPGRLAKTSLLLRDFTTAETEDETWLYLRSFDTFRRLQGAAVEQTLVPGSALSYEDARGFVGTSRYRFAALEPAASGAPRVLACPRSPEIAERLGYGRLYIELDASEPLVRRIDFRGLGGAPLKVYEVETTTRFEGTLFPGRVGLRRIADGLDNAILYQYWKPGKPLPDRLFSTDLQKDGTFVERLREVARDAGVVKQLDEELARAQAVVDAHDERWNPGQESKQESQPKKK